MNSTNRGKTLKIAALQLDCAFESPRKNFEIAQKAIADAAQQGAEVAVLPESFATGFSPNVNEMAAHSSEIRDFLSNAASEFGIFVIAGLFERASQNSLPENRALVFDSLGRCVAQYSKMHPFSLDNEHTRVKPGAKPCCFDLCGIQTSLAICYDLRFPELFRSTCEKTELYIVIANWPSVRAFDFRLLLQARALENQAYVLGVNRVGSSTFSHYAGESIFVSPEGQILNDASQAASVMLCDVNLETLQKMREARPFLKDRRTDLN